MFRSAPFDELCDLFEDMLDINITLSLSEIVILERSLAQKISNLETWVYDHWGVDKYLRVRRITNIILNYPVSKI